MDLFSDKYCWRLRRCPPGATQLEKLISSCFLIQSDRDTND